MKTAACFALPMALVLALGAILGDGFLPQHWGALALAGGMTGLVLRIGLSLVGKLGGGIFSYARKPEALGESGAVMTEFVIVIFPFLMMLFGIMQMALVSLARVLVSYAAFTAARAAIVMVPETRTNESANHLNPDLKSSAKLDAIHNAAAFAMIPAAAPIDEVATDFAAGYADYLREHAAGAVAGAADQAFGNLIGGILGALANGALAGFEHDITQQLAAINTSTKSESVARALEADGWGAADDGASGAIRRALRKFVTSRMLTMVTLHAEDGSLRYTFKWNDPIRARVTFLYMCRIPIANRFAGKRFYDLTDDTMNEVNVSLLGSMVGIGGIPGYYLPLTAEHILVNQGIP